MRPRPTSCCMPRLQLYTIGVVNGSIRVRPVGVAVSGAFNKLVDGRVVRPPGVEQRRHRDELQDLVVLVAIVEDPGAAADGGLAVAPHVPRERDARSDAERAGLVGRPVVQSACRCRSRPSRGPGGRCTPPGRADRSAGPARRAGWPRSSPAGTAPAPRPPTRGRLELRHLVTRALGGLHVVEAEAGVQGEPLGHAPGVLRVPLGDHELAVRLRVAVRLGVRSHRAEQRVREADVGVEGVRAVRVEAEIPVEVRGPLGGPGRILEEEPGLERVRGRSPS